MMIWMVVLARIVFAQDLAVQEYCFGSNNRLREVLNRMKVVLLSTDRTSMFGTCLTIQTTTHRMELIEKYLTHIAPETKISFSSREAPKNLCEIEIEKIIEEKTSAQDLGFKSSNINLEAINKREQKTETSQIKTIDVFEFSYDQKQVKGKCRFINANLYEIELETTNLPPPPVVIYGDSSYRPPPPSGDLQLKVTIQLKRGEKSELGEILRNSKGDKSEANSTPKIELKEQEISKREMIYLSIK